MFNTVTSVFYYPTYTSTYTLYLFWFYECRILNVSNINVNKATPCSRTRHLLVLLHSPLNGASVISLLANVLKNAKIFYRETLWHTVTDIAKCTFTNVFYRENKSSAFEGE